MNPPQKYFPRKGGVSGKGIPIGTILLAGFFAALAAPLGFAQVIYTYSGNHFASFQNGEPPSGAYTTGMGVSGFFEVATAFTPFAGYNFTPLSYEFTDGRNLFSSEFPAGSAYFEIVTDASGTIDWWNIQLRDEPSPGNVRAITTSSPGAFLGQDNGIITQTTIDGEGSFDTGWINSQPGSWTLAVVPEPGVSGLMLAGVILLGFTTHRVKRRCVPESTAAKL